MSVSLIIMCMRITAVTIETGMLIFCACTYAPQVQGSRRGLSFRLSGYPVCLWNQGVRIIYCISHTFRLIACLYICKPQIAFIQCTCTCISICTTYHCIVEMTIYYLLCPRSLCHPIFCHSVMIMQVLFLAIS